MRMNIYVTTLPEGTRDLPRKKFDKLGKVKLKWYIFQLLFTTMPHNLFSLAFFPLFQLFHRAGHHLFKLVGGDAKGLVDVLQRPFHNGPVT